VTRIKEQVTFHQGDVNKRLANGGASSSSQAGALQYAVLICECNQLMEQIVALKRDLEKREAHLVARREQLLRLIPCPELR
jgi:hypothetical protein